jgi:hypothetical protein
MLIASTVNFDDCLCMGGVVVVGAIAIGFLLIWRFLR